MPKFVVISDVHAHTWSAFASGDGLQNSRFRRNLIVLDDSLKRAAREEIPWIFAGDLVHTAGHTLNVVMAGVTEVLSRYPDVKKVMVWGNHDARSHGRKITLDQTALYAVRRAVPNVFILDPGVLLEHEGVTIAGCGYQPSVEHFGTLQSADIGVFHQTVRGSFSPYGHTFDEGLSPEWLLERYRVSIVGHVHHPQQVETPHGYQAIMVPGSPEHHNFGDQGDHGWWVLAVPREHSDDCTLGLDAALGCDCAASEDGVDATRPTVEFVPGGSPRFITVDTPDEVEPTGDYYRVRTMLRGEELPAHAHVIAPSPTVITERDVLKGVGELEAILQAWMKQDPPEGLIAGECLAVGRVLLEAAEPTRLRPMTLQKLWLRDFCSYAAADLIVQEGIWLVTGRGRDYPSNGAGKTTLVGEALYWMLFGRTTKGLSASEIIRWNADACSVAAVFADGQDASALLVKRTKTKTTSVLEVVDKDGAWQATSVAEMTDKLQRYLGITPAIYQNLGYFSQEKLLLFSSATDGERKDVLADLIGLSAYQEASTAANAKATALGRDWAAFESRGAVLAEQMEVITKTLEDAESEEDSWNTNHANSVRAEQQAVLVTENAIRGQQAKRHQRIQDFLRRLDAWDYPASLGGAYADLVATHYHRLAEEVEAQLAAVTADLKAAEEAIAPWDEDMVLRARSAAEERYAEAQIQHDRAEARVRGAYTARAMQERALLMQAQAHGRAVADLQRMSSTLDKSICPTCGQPVTDDHRAKCLHHPQLAVEEEARAVEGERESLRQAELAMTEAQASLTCAIQTRDQMQQVCTEARTRQRWVDQAGEWRRQEQLLQHQRAQLEDAAHQAATQELRSAEREWRARWASRRLRIQRWDQTQTRMESAQLSMVQNRLDALQGQANPYASAVASATKQLQATEKKIKTALEEGAALRTQMLLYQYWQKGFSKQGIQSLLVEEIAALFNAARGDIFPVLTQGVYDAQFSTLSRTRSGEVRERTEFVIFEHGEEIPYGALSGGQRRRVDLGIMLTLSVAVSRWMQVPGILGVLTLDEVFGFLDGAGAEGLWEALQQVQRQIPTIYAVTHDTHLQALFPQVLEVEQDADGISHLVGGSSA